MRQYIRYSFGFVLFLMFFATVPAITASATNSEGIVTVDQLNMRSSNSTSSSIVLILKKGDKVVIKGSKGDWYHVNVQSKEGYVSKKYIEVKPPKISPSKQTETTINVNGKKLELEFDPPTVKVPGGERILVPFRAISEALGINVTWNQSTRQVTAIDKDTNKHVVFTIDDVNAVVNEEAVILDAAPALQKNRTLLPLRFFSETFGAKVTWDQATRTANIDRVIKVEEVIEDVKSISQPVNLEGLQARVTASTLNLRLGPSTTEAVLARLVKDQTVFVTGATKEWLKVYVDGMEGFLNSAHVEIFDIEQKRIKVLASPTITTKDEQFILSWSKLGGTVVQSNVSNNIVQLTTDANLIEEIDLVNEAIELISYETTEAGTIITLTTKDGYSVIPLDTVSAFTLTFFKKSSTKKLIVIDAGHGGKDPGAVGNGLEEKEIILDVSLRVQKLLEQAGYQVLMTRSDDTFLEPGERAAFANKHKADAFVSVHANAAENTSANGTETFWNTTHSGPESKRLAEEIQTSLIQKLGTFDRGVKQGNFQVIRSTTMPSVLVELAFISNKKDAEMMAKDDFRQKSAEAIVEGILKFYK
ncbi:hypothetical protein DS745_05055 [Anaerobacillus alkaliphilus]|uniref:SH3b domain-containing protein n=1 Tax=Anaerobacillus alkaliphilus TaxID=1548597 RepID=A0A4Q0VW88_9BACI|nr:N-acetylmuramoyl-L-alanine amidase [Anaerobacillus alkaliphilus]RXJ02953.1 hypothetical protein DS745_05055 [Anaerobacillus alkaliphilus]